MDAFAAGGPDVFVGAVAFAPDVVLVDELEELLPHAANPKMSAELIKIVEICLTKSSPDDGGAAALGWRAAEQRLQAAGWRSAVGERWQHDPCDSAESISDSLMGMNCSVALDRPTAGAATGRIPQPVDDPVSDQDAG
jgi:hypothetical protein